MCVILKHEPKYKHYSHIVDVFACRNAHILLTIAYVRRTQSENSQYMNRATETATAKGDKEKKD